MWTVSRICRIGILASLISTASISAQGSLVLNLPAQASVGDSFKIVWKSAAAVPSTVKPVVTVSPADKIYVLPDLTAICIGTGPAMVSLDLQGTKAQGRIDIFAPGRLTATNAYPRIISNYYIYKDPGNRYRGIPHAVGETVYLRIEGTAPFRFEIGNRSFVQEAGWFNAMKSSRPGLVEFLLALRGIQAGETWIAVIDGKGMKYTVPHRVWQNRLDAPPTLESGANNVATVNPGGLAPCDNAALARLQQ